ncbi:MAG: adenylate/guanylate cyclase domain-containing protein [Leptospiraceae bacterium]|nr:adenylate/guanylate cyclase domain-containing protein [Leptospiraceae bacterium]
MNSVLSNIIRTAKHGATKRWISGPLFLFVVFSIHKIYYNTNRYSFTELSFFFILLLLPSLVANYKLVSGKWNVSKWEKRIKYYTIIPSMAFGFLPIFEPSLLLCTILVYLGHFLIPIGILNKSYFFISLLFYTTSFISTGLYTQSSQFHIDFFSLSAVLLFSFWLYLVNEFIKNQNNSISNFLNNIRKDRRIIKAEKEISEQLLLNILPKEIADELKLKNRVIPKNYNCVTVMFTDFSGFTKIADHLEANKLVEELDNCFSYFDSVVKKYKLEKIKTIGDSYMTCAGIPTENKTHPLDSILAAIEIQSFMDQMKKIKESQNIPYWELRLGINTGPLVAGVIGEMKFSYDVFGDTVNTASRMESSGEVGKINISKNTYDLVKDFFDCEYRGKVAAKNKGLIDMYFVTGIREELSVRGEKRVPNRLFTEKYKQLEN